jgi:hypothetical protein
MKAATPLEWSAAIAGIKKRNPGAAELLERGRAVLHTKDGALHAPGVTPAEKGLLAVSSEGIMYTSESPEGIVYTSEVDGGREVTRTLGPSKPFAKLTPAEHLERYKADRAGYLRDLRAAMQQPPPAAGIR